MTTEIFTIDTDTGTANAKDSARIANMIYETECKKRKVKFLPAQVIRNIFNGGGLNPFEQTLSISVVPDKNWNAVIIAQPASGMSFFANQLEFLRAKKLYKALQVVHQ